MAKQYVFKPEKHTKEEIYIYLADLEEEGFSAMAKVIYDYCKERGLV